MEFILDRREDGGKRREVKRERETSASTVRHLHMGSRISDELMSYNEMMDVREEKHTFKNML